MVGRPPAWYLPPHLSYKSALVILPSKAVQPPIQQIRKRRAYNYIEVAKRWPPHINLIYPFLNSSFEPRPPDTRGRIGRLDQAIAERILKVTRTVPPFKVILSQNPHYFTHSKTSVSVWLRALDENSMVEGEGEHESQQLLDLQQRLQEEFSECSKNHGTFVPHLSLGHCFREDEIPIVAEKVGNEINRFINRPTRGRNSAAPSREDEESEARLNGLQFEINRVHVLQRRSYYEPFHVVAEIKLGEDEHWTEEDLKNKRERQGPKKLGRNFLKYNFWRQIDLST